MSQTAVEWLFQKLWDEPKDKFTWYALREKAMQMEKEQVELRYKDSTPIREYNSPKLQTIEMEKETLEEAAERLQKDKYGIFIFKDADVKGQLVIDTGKAAFLLGMKEGAKWQIETSVQTEISNEEIWNASIEYDNGAMLETPMVHFQQGAFWYREQLKKK